MRTYAVALFDLSTWSGSETRIDQDIHLFMSKGGALQMINRFTRATRKLRARIAATINAITLTTHHVAVMKPVAVKRNDIRHGRGR